MNRVLIRAPVTCRLCVRGIAGSEVRSVKPDLTKIRKKQAHFQVDNDMPVFLKNGTGDSMTYYASLALTLLGAGISFQALYKLANK